MAYEVTGTVTPDNLIGGHEIELLTTGVLLVAGQGVVKRGSVIGVVTADKKGKLCDKASADGSEVAKYVVAQDADTTEADAMAVCYKTGLFNRDALVFGGVDTAADHEDGLRDVGIFLKDEIAY